MKKIAIALLLLTTLVTGGQAQYISDLASSAIAPYKLDIGYNTTTVLIFPAPLIPIPDRGSKDIIIQQETQVENVLKIKAARKDFEPTNLHAFTKDGKVYVFTVRYAEYPSFTTFNVGDQQSKDPTSLIMTREVINEKSLEQAAKQLKQAERFFSKRVTRYDMKLQLQTIHQLNDQLFFGLLAANSSNLDFDVDFVRLYVRDKKEIKRSSMQEQELIPIYKDTLQKIPGQGEKHFVIAVPRFTIPDKKEFIVELYEKNGGRHLLLKVKNRHLLRARKI